MFEFIKYEAHHALDIYKGGCAQPNAAAMPKDSTWAADLAKHPSMTYMFDGKPVACGGLVIIEPNHRGHVWFMGVANIGHFRIDHRIGRNWLLDTILENNIVRAEAPLRADFKNGVTYAKHLGFKFEAKLEMYHPDRVDALMYVIINDQKGHR